MLRPLHGLNGAADFVQKCPRNIILAVAYLFTIILEVINYYVGHEIRLVFFYFPALYLLSWFVSAKSAIVLAIFSGILWFLIGFDLLSLTDFDHTWNAFMRLLIFLTFIYVVRAYKRERTFSRMDFLTKIANSQHFTELANLEIERCRRYGRPFSVVYMDIDNFKQINDTFGHGRGDDLLYTVAQTIRKNIRSTNKAARLGGGEFAILIPATCFDAACRMTRKLRVILLESIQDRYWQCTFSFGLVTFLSAPGSVNEMILLADTFMYQAKAGGKTGS